MKTTALISALASACALLQTPAAIAADDQTAGDFPYALSFELGAAEFAPGDSITITSVRGTQPTITTGQTYCVTGTYTLSSRPEAELSLFVTATNAGGGRSRIDPRQQTRIQKGSGTFALVETMRAQGYPHISFYPPPPGGSSFGGIYFGQGEGVLRHKSWSILDSTSSTAGSTAPQSEQNRRILEYLGSPVAPPADLDPAYTKAGLISAMRQAAEKADISLKRVEIDDSEFPFLVGIICGEGDYPKMKQQIKQMPAYEEQGGVSSKACAAINITPWRAFPPGAGESIGRRMGVRERMLYDQISRQQ